VKAALLGRKEKEGEEGEREIQYVASELSLLPVNRQGEPALKATNPRGLGHG